MAWLDAPPGTPDKRLRRERDWTAADVEDRIKMKAAYVSFIETGRRGYTLQTHTRLADAFGVDVAELLKPPLATPDRSGLSHSQSAPTEPHEWKILIRVTGGFSAFKLHAPSSAAADEYHLSR